MESVRSLRELAAAREGWSRFRMILRSFPDVRTRASKLSRRSDRFGCTAGRLRWGEVPVALWIERGLPVGSWDFSDGFWMVKMIFWRPWEEFGSWSDFGPKWSKVFEVGRFACGGLLSWRLGGLGR